MPLKIDNYLEQIVIALLDIMINLQETTLVIYAHLFSQSAIYVIIIQFALNATPFIFSIHLELHNVKYVQQPVKHAQLLPIIVPLVIISLIIEYYQALHVSATLDLWKLGEVSLVLIARH